MPGSHAYKTEKKPYASNPHGGEHNYAGKTLLSGGMLPDIEKERKLTDEEKQENESVKSEYQRQKTILTGLKQEDKAEAKEATLTKEKIKKKKEAKPVTKTQRDFVVYV